MKGGRTAPHPSPLLLFLSIFSSLLRFLTPAVINGSNPYARLCSSCSSSSLTSSCLFLISPPGFPFPLTVPLHLPNPPLIPHTFNPPIHHILTSSFFLILLVLPLLSHPLLSKFTLSSPYASYPSPYAPCLHPSLRSAVPQCSVLNVKAPRRYFFIGVVSRDPSKGSPGPRLLREGFSLPRRPFHTTCRGEKEGIKGG